MTIKLLSDVEREIIKITHGLTEQEQARLLKIIQEIVEGWEK